ncbi:Utp21 specific WD40 associated putative domain-containing protein [Lentinula aciculospora]|uniref:Utp21 specific WD40 associated putative domain-containing protein n=1 Tax=Lentinula aciculospora TaxID=153920 RepID=A0A9W9DVC9_9AGAR|nr:Utp21 specific WD40 associated putative domain-containing protein [Lentinula aciculospora]
MFIEELPSPPRKRQRQDQKKTSKPKYEPRLFVPFRALGLITNHLPFIVQTRSHKGATDGPRIHILTCLGKSWALWNGAKMDLLFVGPEVEEQISCMAMNGDAVWIASGPSVIKYIRGKEVSRLVNPFGATLSFIIIFGTQLLSLTEDGGRMFCWDLGEEVLETTIKFDNDFTAISILHPATYLNKVLVSSSQGAIQLWNIRSQSCIHKFTPSSLRSSLTLDHSAITTLTQSSAIDVVGIGFASGEISVYDVRTDELLMRMFMEGGSVRALGFRSDGQPIMASASSLGHIAIWDLNEGGRLLHVVRGAHDGAISALEWVPGQPMLITSGEDNSVKQWLFDSPTATPRLLKIRSGHHSPPHLIRYYGEDGKQLLTVSRDRSLRCTSVVRDSRSFELSQGSVNKKANSLSIPVANLKFPQITAISHSSARTKDWDDILTVHSDETFARTWSMQNKKLGKYSFGFTDATKTKGKERPSPLGSAKSVCVTACGNFGLAGSSTGAIHMWNMQSGIRRRTFSVGLCPPEVAGRFQTTAKGTKDRSITGLVTDSLNTVVIASTLDGTVNFFDFHTADLEHTVILPSAAVSMMLQRDNGLLAVVCDDMIVRLVDIETRSIVREFGGFRGRVLDITFSPDSRWLITTSLDCIIRTFDIPTGRLIDAFRTPSVATSVSFSPTNDFLATSHVDSVGVHLWANRAQYTEVAFQTVVEDDIAVVDLPSMQSVAEDEALDSLLPLETRVAQVDVFSTPPKLDGDLITLTLLPRSKWQTLLNLEVIQQRNKPKEGPKAPEQAPFFLPTLPGVETRFATEPKKDVASQKSTRRLEQTTQNVDSVFLQRLRGDDVNGEYESFFSFAKTLSAAAVDLELRSLLTLDSLRIFINALTQRLLSHQDFEAVQVFIRVFLRMHADMIISNGELHDDVEKLMKVQHSESQRILELVAASLGALGFVRDTL